MQEKFVLEVFAAGRVRHAFKSAGVALMAAGLFFGTAAAAPLSNERPLGQAVTIHESVELAQFIYLGRNYCWYPDGWRGPGWYWCGYAWRTGFGWGGGYGWRGWRGGFRGGPGFHGGFHGGVHHH